MKIASNTPVTNAPAIKPANAAVPRISPMASGKTIASDPGKSIEQLSDFVDDVVARDLSTVKGIASISRIGGADRQINVDLDPARVVVTPGSSGAFMLAFAALFDAGDRVAIARPVHRVLLGAQQVQHGFADHGIVFNKQQAHGKGAERSVGQELSKRAGCQG